MIGPVRCSNRRPGFSTVEVVIAASIFGLVFLTSLPLIRFFTRPVQKNDLTLDQTQQLNAGIESVLRELREARQVVFPGRAAAASRALVIRDFAARLVVFYFDPQRRQLRRVILDPAGLPIEDEKPILANLDGAYFHQPVAGEVSWAFMPGDWAVAGATRCDR